MRRLTLWLALSLVCTTLFAADPAVFINEFHYDNSGTDTGEFIEIAGSAGTDLTGYKIELYNGSGGALYGSRTLSGTIPNHQNGFGTVSEVYPADGIQNGSPDGIALVKDGVVIQFLSYEGSFTATSGTAIGLTSTNIGVTEVGTTPVGHSLQLQGVGSTYSHFTWAAPSANTRNAVNSGQTFIGGGGPSNPSISGTAAPSAIQANASTVLTATVTPGSNPGSTGLAVTADLTSIGGFSAQSFAAESATTFTFTALVPAGTPAGVKTIAVTVTDAEGRSGTASLSLTILPPAPANDHLVISQVYGGGGNGGATYRNDYVEIFNPTSSDFNVSGWSVQYSSAGNTGTWSGVHPLGGVIRPGEYYLVSLASGGSSGAELSLANTGPGDVNLSATTGRVALVRNATPLAGCPLSDPNLVDLVGFGSSNCSEGGANALSPSNTTAIFRRADGNQDTNNNHADFFSGSPFPRRTAEIMEIGPFLVSSDPSTSDTNIPRDGSIIVTFTENVDVSEGWYSITCVETGMHNIATLAEAGRSWVITPNENFRAGERCTVRVFKDFVRDRDTDDSAPNTDLLNANRTWSFDVADGTAPAYPADVHLTMGNPTDATANIAQPSNYLMMKPEYALSYNRDRGTANWVSWHLDDTWVGSLPRFDTFRPDPAVPADWHRVLGSDYQFSGFDRGHMVPNADRDPATSSPINQATFLMTNMIPQAPDNNQGPWASLENYLRTLLNDNEIYIVAGGAGVGGTGSVSFATTIANGRVTVPAQTWKAALVIPKSTDDLTTVNSTARTIAVIMPNAQGIRNDPWQNYLVSVDQVEALAGYDLFENVDDAVEPLVENGLNAHSFSTNEDAARTITLQATSSNSGVLYEIVSGPAHGTLSGSGASQAYTPLPDFNGTDTFTFRSIDNGFASATASVTVRVLPVNDAPVVNAIEDQTVSLDDTFSFTATAYDVDLDALTFSLSATAPAGATIDPVTGVFTWTPASSDLGLTHTFNVVVSDGNATATESVSLTVVDLTAPAMSALTLSRTRLWPANHKMIDVLVSYSATDKGDPAPSCALAVASNEPVNGTGDGDTDPDWEVVDAHKLRLRAERVGTGDGRVYTITAQCTDRSGNFSSMSGTVAVPKSAN